MPPTVTSFLRRVAALLLLLGCTWAVEIAAFVMLVARRPRAFSRSSRTSLDFVAKIRWFPATGFRGRRPCPTASPAPKPPPRSPRSPRCCRDARHRAAAGAVGAVMLSLVSRRAAASGATSSRGPSSRCSCTWPRASPPSTSRTAFASAASRSARAASSSTHAARDSGLAGGVRRGLRRRSAARALEGAAGASLVLLLAVTGWAAGAVEAPRPAPAVASAAADPSRPRRNVLLISLDSLRADHLGAYGYKRDTSPSFDRFAKESVLLRTRSRRRHGRFRRT